MTDTTMLDFGADRLAVGAQIELLCDSFPDLGTGAVAQAIRYSLLGAGKRIRAILLLSAYRAVGGRGDASALAAAVEVVHAYSLVHDDLPCMDDDDVRRGRPTTHRVFGPHVAAVAGVVMVPLAVRFMLISARGLGLPDEECGGIVQEFMRASGAAGMVGGQLLDLAGEARTLTLDELEKIHRAKTGRLIEAAVRVGGIAAGANNTELDALGRYGVALGLAFQIADDVLDATATTAELGKTAGRDAELRKSTYALLLGVDGARHRAHSLANEACGALDAAGLLTDELEQIARFSVERKK
ncbi:MAG: polyprenyl synthetase family protein [Anaerolineae bacterium]|nr:polyprenyl synthetase family protein [Gemmatimonadaceae bacterium]